MATIPPDIDAERALARVAGRWNAARGYRNYRTYWQDQQRLRRRQVVRLALFLSVAAGITGLAMALIHA